MQAMGNAPGLYDKAVLEVSIKNQIKWRNNIGELNNRSDHSLQISLFPQFVSSREMRENITKIYFSTVESTLWLVKV